MGNGKVVLFEEDEKSLNYRFEKFADRLRSTEILSLEYDKENFLNTFEIVGQEPEIGSVYYKHPNKLKCYVDGNLDEYYFMQEKIEFYARIVKLLGAIRFEAKVFLESIEKLTFGANGDLKYQAIEVDATYKETETNKITQKLILERDFEMQPNFDNEIGFNKAIDFYNSHNFSSDPSMIGLIDSRNPKDGSLSKRQGLISELTSDYNKLLEFSAGLNVMGGVFNLNMGFSKKFELIKKVNLDMKIYF